MKPQFSEFTYGYALIEEFSRKYNFTSVPIFPSLVEEGRVGGGYDAGLKIQGIPFFFQFKKSNFLSRSHSKYYKSFNTPYYQFYLHAKNILSSTNCYFILKILEIRFFIQHLNFIQTLSFMIIISTQQLERVLHASAQNRQEFFLTTKSTPFALIKIHPSFIFALIQN